MNIAAAACQSVKIVDFTTIATTGTLTLRILRQDLGLIHYKVVLAQDLKPNDHRLRQEFADWALKHSERYPVIFSDETHFWLIGFINKQICRYWCEDNPEVLHEIPLHSETVIVWCDLWHGGVIGL